MSADTHEVFKNSVAFILNGGSFSIKKKQHGVSEHCTPFKKLPVFEMTFYILVHSKAK